MCVCVCVCVCVTDIRANTFSCGVVGFLFIYYESRTKVHMDLKGEIKAILRALTQYGS